MSTTIQYIAEHPYPLIVGLAVIAGLLFTAFMLTVFRKESR